MKPNPATKKKNYMAGLDRVWRVKYPSRFGRDALCCDILLPPTSSSSLGTGPTRETETEPSRIRLINVHLNSLPVNPSLRLRQHTISASYLRAAGHGVMTGDFNPVLPEDETLIGDNHLVDAWNELYPNKDGFTWGVNGDAPFPPGRLDKVATLGLKSCGMKVVQPSECTEKIRMGQNGEQEQDYEEFTVPWSDHSGLVYEFGL